MDDWDRQRYANRTVTITKWLAIATAVFAIGYVFVVIAVLATA